LRRNFERFLTERYSHHAVDRSKYQHQARTFGGTQEATETKNHSSLVLCKNLDGAQYVQQKDDNNDSAKSKPYLHRRLHATHNAAADCNALSAGEGGIPERDPLPVLVRVTSDSNQ
jgi:hypothetical protein